MDVRLSDGGAHTFHCCRLLLRLERMSYDLMLVRAPAGASEEDIRDLALAAAEAELPHGPPDPELEARKQSLAEALRAACPELEAAALDYAEIAQAEGIAEAEARQRYRWIELNGPQEGAGIQITLYDTWVSISMPYGQRSSTDAALAELWRYLEVLARESGFVVYDPQGMNVVDVAAGPDGTRGAAAPELQPPRPWWRFW